jgi:hypothetical protein
VGVTGPGRRLVVAAALTVVLPVAAQEFETPPTLRAADVLPREALKGPHHEVADEVASDGVGLVFSIRSTFGTFVAPSRELAELRIAEVGAIAQLKGLGRGEMFASGMVDSVKRKAETLQNVVEDPEGTVHGMGRGLKGLFDRGRQATENAGDLVQGGDGAGGGAPTLDTAVNAVDEVLGVNAARRKIARSVGADPYSTNVVLQKELTRLADALVAGGMTADFAVGQVPGASVVTRAAGLAWDLPPEDLRTRNEKALEAMGCDAGTVEALLDNRAYAPTLATELVEAVQDLGEVEGRPVLVALAAGARNEAEARFYRSSVRLLAAAQAEGRTLRRARGYGRALAALTGDGTLLVAVAVDLLTWQEGVREAVETPVPEARARSLWLTGHLSERTGKELRRRGFDVREGMAPHQRVSGHPIQHGTWAEDHVMARRS